MSRTNIRWSALVLVIPLLAAGCAHRSDRAIDAALAPDAVTHDGPGAQDTHARDRPAVGHASRWPADAPLVRGMSRIRAVADALGHASHGHLDAAQVQALAAELRSAVETMFVQCRLEPEPDAALHPLLARVLGASRALSEGRFDAAAQAELRAVLARYAELFEESSADQIDSA